MLLSTFPPRRFANRAGPVCAQLTIATFVALVNGALAQGTSSGSQTDSASSAPPSSYPAVGTPQFQPATAGGYSTTPSGPRLAGTTQLAGGPPVPESELFTSGEGLLQWGMLHLYPHFAYQLTYGNGLQSSPGQQGNTLINQFSPGVLVRLGPHWAIDYTPTLRFYSDPRFQDGTDQAVSLSGSAAYGDWLFGLSMGFSDTTQPLVETAAQTTQEALSTALSAAYQLNSKVSFDFGLNQSLRFVGQSTQAGQASLPAQLSNMREWSTLEWMNYQIVPRLTVGLGVGLTYDSMSVGSDVMSEQYEARIEWHAGNKLSLLMSGGLNDQQFLGSGVPDLLSPIFSLSVHYQLFEPTSLYLAANSGTAPSYFANQASDNTGVNAGIHQRLVGRLFLDISGAYGTTKYHGTSTAPKAPGISNYSSTSFNAALSTTFVKRLTASAFFQAAYNSSGSTAYNYNTTQVGLTLGYSF
jgi:hypothetical protein